jgi:hypothetical protein
MSRFDWLELGLVLVASLEVRGRWVSLPSPPTSPLIPRGVLVPIPEAVCVVLSEAIC